MSEMFYLGVMVCVVVLVGLLELCFETETPVVTSEYGVVLLILVVAVATAFYVGGLRAG